MAVVRIVSDLRVGTVPESLRWYGELLGTRTVMDHGWIATVTPADRPELQLSLMTHDETAPVVPAVSIQVDNLDEVHAAALAAGLTIVHPLTIEPWGVRRFFVRDPDGNVLNILEHVQSA